MIDDGERFIEQCATSNPVIGGSVFHHKRIHKATLVSSDLSTETRSITCESQGSFVALFRMYVSIEEKTWLWAIIFLSLD
ncbi:hypothetical protein DPMN_011833 [Dreissena polymorpha]|uniref:Uncharacterized protein n=1 Tax=Dreissena polymorpha TaxID=45954 RepID=A0A9D4N4E8_DREPO|nr:hypothetical protein DPMN_011833 [Dreissena polymorpha]